LQKNILLKYIRIKTMNNNQGNQGINGTVPGFVPGGKSTLSRPGGGPVVPPAPPAPVPPVVPPAGNNQRNQQVITRAQINVALGGDDNAKRIAQTDQQISPNAITTTYQNPYVPPIVETLSSLSQLGLKLRNQTDTDEEILAFGANIQNVLAILGDVKVVDYKVAQNGRPAGHVVQSGLKGLRNLITSLKRLGLIDFFLDNHVRQLGPAGPAVPARLFRADGPDLYGGNNGEGTGTTQVGGHRRQYGGNNTEERTGTTQVGGNNGEGTGTTQVGGHRYQHGGNNTEGSNKGKGEGDQGGGRKKKNSKKSSRHTSKERNRGSKKQHGGKKGSRKSSKKDSKKDSKKGSRKSSKRSGQKK
jgi:hypothetical protein